MPQETGAVHVELNFSSQEVKQHLLNLIPSKILLVQSIDKAGHHLYLECNGVSGPTDPLQTSKVAFPASDLEVPRISDPQGEDPKGTNAQDQETNSDADKLAVQSLQQPQQIIAPAQSLNFLVPTYDQPLVASLEPVSSQQQCSGSSASCISKVSFEAAQPEDQKGPSDAIPVVGKTKGEAAKLKDEMVFTMHPIPLSSLTGFPTSNSMIMPEEQATDNMEESATYTLLNQQQQGEDEDEQSEPANGPSGDVELSTVGSSSHSHIPPSKQSQYSSIPSTSDHKVSDQETTNTTTVGLPLNRRRADHERTEKRRLTVHCLLHEKEKEKHNYDEAFAIEFNNFLNEGPNTVKLSADNKEGEDCMWYIEDHLKQRCPSFCSKLWNFCTANYLCNLYKYADEGLLLYSKRRKDKIGSICNDFANLKSMKEIGRGGFGIVYLYTLTTGERLAIKKETKYPLSAVDPMLFKKIMELKHPHVIETLEYLVAHSDEDKRSRSYLLVMPSMNRKGLDKQFKQEIGCGSVLTYMKKYQTQMKFIFRNFLNMFHQVFDGLDYLREQKLVHRDVKASNILVQQNCQCKSPLMCICPEGNEFCCVLGDMNLLCVEGESSLITSEMWHRMAMHEPAGTPRMKAPESFYRTGEGDAVIGHKSDVWSGCVTMMNALIGKEVNEVPDTQIGIFLRTATKTVENASNDISSCCNVLKNIIKKYSTSVLVSKSGSATVTGDMNSLLVELQQLHKKLNESGEALKKVQAFQGGVSETQNKESPLAGILFTVYVANSLHWTCLSTLPHIYNTPLWKCICDTLDIIAGGVRFIPENRKDACEVVGLLQKIEMQVMS